MTINREVAIGPQHFSGGAHLQSAEDRALANQVRGILQEQARDRVNGANVLDLVDNSTGQAGIVFVGDVTGGNFEDLLTTNRNHGFVTGEGPFRLAGADLPSALTTTTDYWVIVKSATELQLALSKPDAITVPPVAEEIGDDGSGTDLTILALMPADDYVAVDLSTAGGASVLGTTFGAANTVYDTIANAHSTLANRLNLVLAQINAGSMDDGQGTDGAGTIAAIDQTVGTDNTDEDDALVIADAIIVEAELRNNEATLVNAIERARSAVGLVTTPTGLTLRNDFGVARASTFPGKPTHAVVDASETEGDLTATLTNAVASDATTSVLGVAELEFDEHTESFAGNVALFAILIDEITASTGTKVTEISVYFNPTDFTAPTSQTFQSPVDGRVRSLRTMITDAALATADNEIGVDLSTGTITGLIADITSGAAIGVVDVDTTTNTGVPGDSATNHVNKGDTVTVTTEGTGTAAGAIVWVGIEETNENRQALAGHAGNGGLL